MTAVLASIIGGVVGIFAGWATIKAYFWLERRSKP